MKLLAVIVFSLLFLQYSIARTPESSVAPLNKTAFVENKGQITDQYGKPRNDIDFKLEGNGVVMFAGDAQLHYQWSKNVGNSNPEILNPKQISNSKIKTENEKVEIYRLDVELLGANKKTEVITSGKQAYYENYYLPAIPDGATAYSYKKITYKNVYPNIDWVLYCNEKGVKYDFVVHPGGNPADIRIQYNGATKLEIEDGALTASTPYGSITENAPYSYYSNSKEEVSTKFVLNGNVLSYNIPSISNHQSSIINDLVIDPTLKWATYFGGSDKDYGSTISTDAAGNIYMTGWTMSTANIATSGAFQTTYSGNVDGYLTKFNDVGSLQWGTYYGGGNAERFYNVCTDGAGNIFVTGDASSNGLASSGAFLVNFSGQVDALLVKFNSSGIRQWATYYGGGGDDGSRAIKCDNAGNVILTVITDTSSGLATPGAFQTAIASSVIVKFSGSGSRLWSTYYNINSTTVAIDGIGNIYIGGYTLDSTLATAGAHQVKLTGSTGSKTDAFLVKFNSTGSRLWGTYYGGTSNELAYDATCDVQGNVYLAGHTTGSTTNIATSGTHQTSWSGSSDGFIVKFNSSGQRIWGTYYGGTGEDNIQRIITDNACRVYIAGTTLSTNNFAASATAYQPVKSGPKDEIFAGFTNAGKRFYGTFYGGSGGEGGSFAWDGGIAFSKNHIVFCNSTTSTASIATGGAYQTVYGGNTDAFLVQFELDTMLELYQPMPDTMFCIGDTLQLIYAGTPAMRTGNIFTIQLSDAAGSFASPLNLTTATSTTGGTYNWIVPSSFTPGSSYKVRLISTAPVDTFLLDFPFAIRSMVPASVTISHSPSHIWPGLNVTFTATPVNGGIAPTYQWKLNGIDIPGATGSTWDTTIIKHHDKVSCVLTSNYECAVPKQATSNVLDMIVAVGISNLEKDSYHIFPNPTNEILYIEGLIPNSTIQLLDVYGRLIYRGIATQKNEAINTSQFAPGNYILQITHPDGERTTRKVVKE